jgi:perosamine synthetase
VIMPSFLFTAVANAVRYERATPVFADIDPATLNLDPAAVEGTITARTRAILAVHTFGFPADIEKLAAIAEKHRLIFGFCPNKQITTGEGGAVATNGETLRRRRRRPLLWFQHQRQPIFRIANHNDLGVGT